MTPYENKKPRYVREWYVKLRQRMKKMREKRLKDQTPQESAPQSTTQSPAKQITHHTLKTEDKDDDDDSYGREKDD